MRNLVGIGPTGCQGAASTLGYPGPRGWGSGADRSQMSDVPQGPGWWQASDQRWYPPETHPAYQRAPYMVQGAPPPYPPAAPPYLHPYPVPPGYGAPVYANYGQRLGGWLLDCVILLAVSLLVSALTHSIHSYHTAINTSNGSSFSQGFHIGMPGALLSPIIIVLYGTLMCGSRRGQTLGMMVAGTRVVKASTGQPIGYAAALWRAAFEWVMAVLLFLPWVIDMLFPIWDSRKQTLHDKVSGTVVIQQH